jgi:hypothetical protein
MYVTIAWQHIRREYLASPKPSKESRIIITRPPKSRKKQRPSGIKVKATPPQNSKMPDPRSAVTDVHE